MVHDDPEFVEGAAAALRPAGHKVDMFREPMEALIALETAQFEILITRAPVPGRAAKRCGAGSDGPNDIRRLL